MPGLADIFSQQSIGWLIISAIVAIVSGVITSWLTYRFKRQEIIDNTIATIEIKQRELSLQTVQSKDDRVRQEIVRWANPILGAVGELINRLDNILERKGYLALDEACKKHLDPSWSISYDYLMNSSIYLFGQYFAWVRMLQEELNFELFQSQQEKDKFFKLIAEVSDTLASYPPKKYECSGKDTQVFRLQQRAIGELLIYQKEHRSCLSYPAFLQKMNDEEFSQHLKPLKALFEGLTPKDECRWKRLTRPSKLLKN